MVAGAKNSIRSDDAIIADFNMSIEIGIDHYIGVQINTISDDNTLIARSGGIDLAIHTNSNIVSQPNVLAVSYMNSQRETNIPSTTCKPAFIIIVAKP